MEKEKSESLREKLEFHKRWLNERLHNDSNGLFDDEDSEKLEQSSFLRPRDISEPHSRNERIFNDERSQENTIPKASAASNNLSYVYNGREYQEEFNNQNKSSLGFYEETKRPKRWEILYNLNKKNIQNKEQAAAKKTEDVELDPECTFKPKIRSSNLQTNKDPLSIHERNKQWKERKEAKLAMTREVSKDRDLKGCTFRPNIASAKINKSFQGVSSYESKGIEKYLKRQIVARKTKEEKEMILENPLFRLQENPTKRERKVTIPKEPRFGETKPYEIPSLKKPIIPTNVSKFSSGGNRSFTKQVTPLGERHDNIHKIHQFFDEPSIHVQDVGFVEALATLHSELHKMDIKYD